MKHFNFFLWILLPASLYGQAYQSVVIKRTGYYSGTPGIYSDSGQVYAIRIDSIENIPEGKRLFQYRQLNNINPYCLGASWIGSEIIVMNNGINIFVAENYFTGNPDTFQINTLSSPGNTFLFHRFADGSYLEAICNGIDLNQVLNTSDSVKTFSFQLKKKNGSSINSWWNQKEIKLSKSKGLVSFYNLLTVQPSSQDENIRLIGFTNPQEGYHPAIAASVFDFSIGDEFQTIDTQPFWLGTWHNIYQKKIVIDKSTSVNGDTLKYTFSISGVIQSWSNFNYQGTNSFNDTSYQKIALSNYFPIDSLPFSVQHDSTYNGSYDFQMNYGYNQIFRSSYCGLDVIKIPTYFGRIDSSSGCLNDFLCFGACWVYEFGPGLGITKLYSADYANYGYSLVYYKKANDFCGTPINFDLLTGIKNISSSPTLILYPNPAKNILFIHSDNPIKKIEIMDAAGKNCKNFYADMLAPENFSVDLKNLPRGIYYIKLFTSDQIILKNILIQR
ncbi:MAG: T9SS type A sorting domain-containing protein [Chitinophagales bacterium]|nr:T9SS type A sorting domain-containing protein [Chitinophagales bacterium]